LQPVANPLWPVLGLMLNALVWGTSWWPFRLLQSHGLHPLWATSIIYLFAVVCLLAYKPSAWRGLRDHPLLWLLVLSSGLTNVGFNWAITVGDVVRVVLLFYVMPAWSVLLAWPLLGERSTWGAVARLLLALAGVMVVLKTPESPWPVPEGLADWLGLMAGFMFALTNVLLRKLNHTPDTSRMVAMFGGGAVMALLAALIGMQLGLVTAVPALSTQWAYTAAILCVLFLAGNMALQFGAARLQASATSLIMLTEVIFASVSAALLGAGDFTLRSLLGGALILAASLLSVWPGRASANHAPKA
jgi:drug/metabolite transporter (DMT)-like permease